MKNGYTVEPTYNDGDFWYFSVDDNFVTYDSRPLKGIYELRYSGKRFQVFRGTQRITSKEGQIGVLLAMVGQGTFRGGQSLRFPLSVNQKWSHEYKSGIRGSDVVNSWNSETTVRSVENVTTRAGKFWALKLVSNAWRGRGTKATFTYYYSPQAKTIVAMTSEFPDGNRIVELIKFGSGQ